MRMVALGEERIPALGQGTWGMGEDRGRLTAEVDALREGFRRGMTVVDTAELYAGGGAERVVGEAIRDCRDEVFVITKVWPSHASEDSFRRALAGSLRRLGSDHVDAVLLHWPTRSVPFAATLRAMRAAQAAGEARHIGVSNFDDAWLDLVAAAGGSDVRLNEVPWSLGDRRVERTLHPRAKREGEVLVAYSPLAHGADRRWRGRGVLVDIAKERGVPWRAVALAWLIGKGQVLAIPKAATKEHVAENSAAGDLVLGEEEVRRIEAEFPPAAQDFHPALPPYGAFHRLAFFAVTRMSRTPR
jgi:diketogulonate reductase-like aldo/keto reductase